MKNTTKLFYILIINISLLLIMGTSIALAEDVPENISVVMDNNYPPYSFLNADGKLQGITIDQWKLFEEKTGIKVTITGMEWSQAFAAMQAGKFDVIDTISFNTERDAYLDYTKPYTTIDVPIFFHQNISGITDVNSLKGFTVAAKKGDNAINILRQNGITSIVEYHSAEDLIKAAKEQKLVVFVMGKPPAMYYMYKMQIQDKFKLSSSYLYTSQFHRAVHAGNKELLDILNNGFGEITESEYKEIDNKWYGNTGYATFKDSALVKWLMISVFTIIAAALFLFIWNRALHNKVFRKTQELSCSLAALQTSEYTFRKLFEKSSDPILILDTYTFIDCNNATLDLLGYESKQEIIGENPWNISPEMQPDGSASKEKILDIIDNAESKAKFEWWLQKKDGDIIPVEIMLTHIILHGKTVTHGLLRDISERKQMETRLEYLSYHDQLTGLYNRRFFEEELKRINTARNLPLTIVMADVNGLKLINDSFGHSFGDELLKKVGAIIKTGCRTDDIIARLAGDEFLILLPQTNSYEAEQITRRIKQHAANENCGSVSISISFGWESKEKIDDDIAEILKKAEDNMYKEKLYESPSMRGKTISAIIKTLHEKNKREEQHSHRVALICAEMGQALGFPEAEIHELRTVGLLHDIGKIAIDENILNKPGTLDEYEWKEIKRHPEIGYRILSTVNDMAEMAEYVLAHHERWDGTGYPKGLKNKETPLKSRIIAIADAFDAITSQRSYRSGLSKELAVEELKSNAGTQFDPALVEIFLDKVLHTIWNQQ